MKRIIVSDSSAELNETINSFNEIKTVPFFIDVLDRQFVDDGSIDIKDLLNTMKESDDPARTAAPTPESFFEAAKDYDEVFYVTISSKLSTTYNNAFIAKQMLEEEYDNIKVHVFDSKSASCGETQVISWINEATSNNLSFQEIIEYVEERIEDIGTIFVLEDLDNLIKNGRMSKVSGFIASALSIYPVCINNDGEIDVKYKPRGIKSALRQMVKTIGELKDNIPERTLYITHVQNRERAETVRDLVEKTYNFKSIEIFEASGLSSIYANNNGIILAF